MTSEDAGGHTGGRARRVLWQLAGFGVGLGLFGWAISLALSEQNRSQLERLSDASAWQVALLLVFSAVTLFVNGLVFWVTMLPIQRLRVADLLATNAFCSFLSYLPFKLSVITRVAIHHRRDGVPLLRIGAWFGAILVVLVAALGPVAVATAWRQRIDWLWFVSTAVLLVGSIALFVGLSKVFEGKRGMRRLRALLLADRIGIVGRVLDTNAAHHVHDGFTMTAHAGAVVLGTVLRVGDLLAQTGRFMVAAAVLDVPLGFDGAMILTVTYFMIAVVSPVGLIGAREAGVVAVAAALGLGGGEAMSTEAAQQFALVGLLVTAADLVVTMAGAALGLAWLGPHKLLRTADFGEQEDLLGHSLESASTISPDADRAEPDQPDDR